MTVIPVFSRPEYTALPIFDNLLEVLGRRIPSRPTLFEFFLNMPLYEKLAGAGAPGGGGHTPAYLRWLIAAFTRAGSGRL